MIDLDKGLESVARRAAKRAGLYATKSRERTLHLNNLGGFRLIDPGRNVIVCGEYYDMSSQDVINVCTDLSEGRWGNDRS